MARRLWLSLRTALSVSRAHSSEYAAAPISPGAALAS
jgi:hypothetical protein